MKASRIPFFLLIAFFIAAGCSTAEKAVDATEDAAVAVGNETAEVASDVANATADAAVAVGNETAEVASDVAGTTADVATAAANETAEVATDVAGATASAGKAVGNETAEVATDVAGATASAGRAVGNETAEVATDVAGATATAATAVGNETAEVATDVAGAGSSAATSTYEAIVGGGGADNTSARRQTTRAMADIKPLHGSGVSGEVYFTLMSDGVMVNATVKGLSRGKHGFHVHEGTSCDEYGGHFNPTNAPHGSPDDPSSHLGDLGNILAQRGTGEYDALNEKLKLSGDHSIIGHAIIVHRGEDKITPQPSGDSGPEIGCGIIKVR